MHSPVGTAVGASGRLGRTVGNPKSQMCNPRSVMGGTLVLGLRGTAERQAASCLSRERRLGGSVRARRRGTGSERGGTCARHE